MTKTKLPPEVTGLGAFIPTGDHTGKTYCRVSFRGDTEAKRHAGADQIVRMALGGVHEHEDGDYAILDCYDDEGSIITDLGIRDRAAFQFLYRKLGWRLEKDQ